MSLPSFFAIVLYWKHAVFVGTDTLLSHWSAVVPFLPYGPPPTEHCQQLLLGNHNTCCHLDEEFDKDMLLSNQCSVCKYCFSSNRAWKYRLLSLPCDRSGRQCHWSPVSEMQQIFLLFYWYPNKVTFHMLQCCCRIVLSTVNRRNSLKNSELFPNFTHLSPRCCHET